MSLRLVYHEVTLSELLRTAAYGIELPQGHSLFSHEIFVDHKKDTVVFRLCVNAPSEGK